MVLIMRKLAETVEYLHARAVVHRDLKPSNIMYASEARAIDSLRVADFGFAKQVCVELGVRV